MNTFGAQLRQTRDRHGWSIEYVSFKSKIPLRILESLERDDYSAFASACYAKSFLKKYSGFLGLDFAAEISRLEIIGYSSLESYFARKTIKENLESTEFSTKTPRFQRSEKNTESPIFLSAAVMVLFGLVASFYYVGSQADMSVAGARDVLQDFENTRGSFSRVSVVKDVKDFFVRKESKIREVEFSGMAKSPQITDPATSPEIKAPINYLKSYPVISAIVPCYIGDCTLLYRRSYPVMSVFPGKLIILRFTKKSILTRRVFACLVRIDEPSQI